MHYCFSAIVDLKLNCFRQKAKSRGSQPKGGDWVSKKGIIVLLKKLVVARKWKVKIRVLGRKIVVAQFTFALTPRSTRASHDDESHVESAVVTYLRC